MRKDSWPLLATAAALVALPFALLAAGLTLTSAIDVVVFAIACLGLNILVGHTGLVSFGHGAFFGLAGYAAALAQRTWFPDGFVLPALFALAFVLVVAGLVGFLILRRRGVYFSLLTLALTALLYAVAFRWTALTGGENGLGGLVRPIVLGIDLSQPWRYYALVAAVGFLVVLALWRFHHSPIGSVLVAIRENEQRARFVGYPTNRYKILALAVSAGVTAVAGVLSVFNHRFASADPLSIAFSGELLAMVVIGGMRSLLGPAIGALFFILFREFLSIWTQNWLFWFGLLFVGFIIFSPTGLVGIAERVLRPFRRKTAQEAAMASRQATAPEPLPPTLRPADRIDGPILVAQGIAKHFGGIKAVQGVDIAVRDRSLHALIGPNGAGKTTAFNLISGMYVPDEGTVMLKGRSIAGFAPENICAAGVGRSFQITNLFPTLSVEENVRLACQARHASRFDPWRDARTVADVRAETAEVMRYLGLAGIERAEAGALSYGGQPLLALAGINTFYGKSHILADVTFDVHAHEILALLGRNGAGKSTLLKSLIGIAPPGSGSIMLAGREIAGLPPADIARLGIGYVPQGRGLFAGMTVAENLELGRLRRETGNGVRWDRERVFDYFPRIRERLHTPADYLSGGEQQLVAVARA